MTSQFLAPALREGEEEVEQIAPAAPPRRLRRAGADEGAARDRARGGAGARRRARPRAPRRPARPRQDDARDDHPRGARRRHAHRRRPGARAEGRHGGDPHGPRERDVLFIDEIHRLNRAIEEILYPALEDFRLDIIVGQGAAARTLTLDLPPFTLVGATTRTGLLTTPLRDRFGMTFRLGYYEPDELASIVHRSARILDVEIDDGSGERDRSPRPWHAAGREPDPQAHSRRRAGAARGGRHARRSPARRSSCSRSTRSGSSGPIVSCSTTIAHKFGGGPVGLSTLAVSLGEEPDTIEDVYEPYLLQLGFLQRTPRGRVITALGREHVGAAAEPAGSSDVRRIWTPGAAGPLDEFVERLTRMVRGVCERERAGAGARSGSSSSTARATAQSVDEPEPGFGFFSFTPHARGRRAGRAPGRSDRGGALDRALVPVGAIAHHARRAAERPAVRLRAAAA